MRRTLVAALVAASLFAPAAARAETVAIVGGRVEPVSAPPIANGTVLIRDGRIIAVGTNVAIPPGARRIDARGKIVTPGFINAATVLGLVELGEESSTRDASTKDAVAADFQSWNGFFSESAYIASTREDCALTRWAISVAEALTLVVFSLSVCDISATFFAVSSTLGVMRSTNPLV